MEAYAVVETGGKQYMVRKGDLLQIEKLEAKAGDSVSLSPVLALSNGTELTVGVPEVAGAAVKAEVLAQIRGKKVVSFRKKRRKGFHKKIGHRQSLTRIRISDIGAG